MERAPGAVTGLAGCTGGGAMLLDGSERLMMLVLRDGIEPPPNISFIGLLSALASPAQAKESNSRALNAFLVLFRLFDELGIKAVLN